ncbi:fumarylacetoacetate hydrolase family protein [Roseiflexus sp.]|uniref:fumarylacetoacetate hydrolase family protein n=1 Tax=Roseiflexus sp. TaxID=2562120 RepID=UPI00398AE410
MRLVTFQFIDRQPRVGVVIGDTIIDLAAAAPLVFDDPPPPPWSLLDVLEGIPEGMGIDGAAEIVAAVIDQIGGGHDEGLATAQYGPLTIGGVEMLIPLDEARLLAPLPRPSSLRCFEASEQHMAALARLHGGGVPYYWYERPLFTFGNHIAIFGPDATIPLPRTVAFDYELEVACVIGRAGRDIHPDEANEYIAGYLLLNDWTARDVQREELLAGFAFSKSKDAATSVGPWLATPDELDEYALDGGHFNLTLIARVNGVEQSRGNLRDLTYAFAQMIAAASQDCTLSPGDMIACGGVGGSLLEATDGQGPWIEPDDLVELEASGLGLLRNRIVA